MGSDGACEARGPSPFLFLCSHEAGQENLVPSHRVSEVMPAGISPDDMTSHRDVPAY